MNKVSVETNPESKASVAKRFVMCECGAAMVTTEGGSAQCKATLDAYKVKYGYLPERWQYS